MENQTIGIKLADGSFYPILSEGSKASMVLELTTVRDDQQTVQLDLYRSPDATMENAEYVDTLLIENLIPRPREEPTFSLKIDLDENNTLSASIEDKESGETSSLTVSLLNLDATRLSSTPDFALADENSSKFEFGDPADIPDENSSDAAESDGEETAKKTDYGIDYHFSDVSILEDVPRQNKTAIEQTSEFQEHSVPVQEEDDFTASAVEEEDFPDFQDIAVSDAGTEEETVHEEDDSALFDFGEEFKDDSFDDSIPAPSFSFSDLYEEEDMNKEEKNSRKMLIPVIICILCAIISVAALGLMFFFGPASSKESVAAVTEPVPAVEPVQPDVPPPAVVESVALEPASSETEIIEPAGEAAPEPPAEEAAVVNEVVKIETEVVVPEIPEAPKEEVKGVSYKIRWGDTLWDLSDSYYKNPWLYPKIAKFNGIKNPDLIISGTWITIPPK